MNDKKALECLAAVQFVRDYLDEEEACGGESYWTDKRGYSMKTDMGYLYGGLDELKDLLEKRLKFNNRWIKYSEQKPEKDGKYFVAEVYKDRVGYELGDFFSKFPADLMRIGEWRGPDFYIYWDDGDEWYPVSTYGHLETYWMPIPELPKKEEI